MKNLLGCLLFTFFGLVATAQPTTGTTVYGKVPQSSVIYDLPFGDDIVVAALQTKMSAYNVSPKKVKGFYVYRSVIVPEISSRPINLYFSVDRKSKKDKENSILTMLIADEKDIFMQSVKEVDFFRRGKDFVSSFKTDVNLAQHNFEVANQEKEVDNISKKIKKLENEQEDLKKKIKKLEEQLSDNEKNLKSEKENLDSQNKQLETLKNKN